MKLDKLQILVTGTGRCGTVYMAKLLTSIGLGCTHEAIFKHDGILKAKDRLSKKEPLELSVISQMASEREKKKGITWLSSSSKIVAESSYMAAPYLDDPIFDGVKIIHVIRKPMEVINSFVAGFDYFKDSALRKDDFKDYHNFIYGYVPRLYENIDPVSRAALYYIKWNEMIEEKCANKNYLLYKVESSPSKVFNFLGAKPKDYYKNTQANHKEGLEQKYTDFKDIKVQDIRDRLIALNQKYYKVKII